MSLVFLSIGTLMIAVFIIFLARGKKYDYLFESLEGNDFPLANLYGMGMALQKIRIFRIPSGLASTLRKNTKLYFGQQYSEYYTRVIWTQSITLGLLLGSIFFVLCGIFPDLTLILGIIGAAMLFVPGYIFINNISDRVNARQKACENDLPNAISKLTLLVNSGVILHNAWEMVAYGSEGIFYSIMQQACEDMKNGRNEIDAIINFGFQTNSEEIKKFASALTQSMKRGAADLPIFLRNQSRDLWQHHRQVMLQRGEKAASALLAPIAIMFAGVMLIVIAAAMQSFSM